jgi:NAD(P)-dependent dehydrogenase (short-subunit alcohol dehydrogenase family)
MSVSFDFEGRVAVVTGACGALGSAAVEAFRAADATVAAVDIVQPDDEDSLLTPDEGVSFYRADLTEEDQVEATVGDILDDHSRIDALCNVAGTWRGGSPVQEYNTNEYDFLMDVNCKSAFLTSKYALSHLRETEGAIVNVSSKTSLEGGEGDAPYRMSKAAVRLLTESVAEENRGVVRANAVMPSVLDTPMNRDMMEPSDDWVDPADVARTMLALCSDAAPVTSGAAVPVYGKA